MALHVEEHEVDGENRLVLVTDCGRILANFVDSDAAEFYKHQASLSWIFAHEVGRTGI